MSKDKPYTELQGGAYIRDPATGERRPDPEQAPAAKDEAKELPAKPKKGD